MIGFIEVMLQCWGRGAIGKVWRNNLGVMGPGAGAMVLGLFPLCSAVSSFFTIRGSLTEFTTEWIFDGECLFFSEGDGDEQTFCSLLFLDCSSLVASTALTFQSLGDLLHVGVSVWGGARGGEVCFYSLFLFCLLVDG